MQNAGQHVIRCEKGWRVIKGGAFRARRVYKCKDDAIEAAKRAAMQQRTTLYIHDDGGRIIQRETFKD